MRHVGIQYFQRGPNSLFPWQDLYTHAQIVAKLKRLAGHVAALRLPAKGIAEFCVLMSPYAFHSDHYTGSYTTQALKTQAQWIMQQLSDGKDVFAYSNNDAEGYAVRNAVDVKQYVFV